MKTLIQNPGKKKAENKYWNYFIFRESKTKTPRGIITAPPTMESSSAEYKFFRGDQVIWTYHTHNTQFGNRCFSMNHGRF